MIKDFILASLSLTVLFWPSFVKVTAGFALFTPILCTVFSVGPPLIMTVGYEQVMCTNVMCGLVAAIAWFYVAYFVFGQSDATAAWGFPVMGGLFILVFSTVVYLVCILSSIACRSLACSLRH